MYEGRDDSVVLPLLKAVVVITALPLRRLAFQHEVDATGIPHVASIGRRVELWAGDGAVTGAAAVEDDCTQPVLPARQHHVLHVGVVRAAGQACMHAMGSRALTGPDDYREFFHA